VSSALAVEPERLDARVLSFDLRRDGIAVVSVEARREKHNAITPGFCGQLVAAIERAEQDPSVAGVVLASARVGFVESTNADLLKAIKFATDAERFAREVSRAFARIAALRKPVVAAVHGPALGGGFELALAAHAIVASDHPKTSFALPEVRLGLVPAGNGVLRVAQRSGLRVATELATTGRTVGALSARECRLVDDICPQHLLLEAAARRAKALVGRGPLPTDRREGVARLIEENPIARALVFQRARRHVRTRTHGHCPAPERILDVLERYASRGFDAAADLEAKIFGELVVSETAHRLIEVFFATRELAKDRGMSELAEPRAVHSAVVVGGGRIGSGVAFATVSAGVAVRLKEEDDARAGLAMKSVRRLVEEASRAEAETSLQRERMLSLLSVTADSSGTRTADIVIEAVPETLALKQTVLRDIERVIEPTCVYASTTSSISIAQIAQAASRPERVLGMHYFHPVSKVELVEIVRADKTEPWAVATTVALARRQGKTPVVVKDGPGFFTTRIMTPLLVEAALLVGDGALIESVDAALLDWGFPLGPLQLIDDIGLETSLHIGKLLHAAFPERIALPIALEKLLGDSRRGRANGRGFYRYDTVPGGREARRSVDFDVYTALGVSPTTRLPVEEIQMRCALALVNEAARCVGDGVVRSPRDADLAAILGLGFPRFRGGPLRYVDAIGAAETLRRVQSYADRFGERWKPAPLLVQMAKKGERFYP
jgi:3-hydroxyacyl-CoA dehydrogenase/enoyl-CoA hydratase/3-hydroxybutyryl-CoA epimerase